MTSQRTPAEVLLSKRVLMVTGKGGVGKTTLAAALAKSAAAAGRRTLAIDVERSLETTSQLLSYLGGGRHFSADEPVVVGPQLSCARLSASAGHQQFLVEQLPFKWLVKAALRSRYINRFLSMAPGFQDLGILYRSLPYLREKRPDGSFVYEHIVIDLPATGHALALTSIPGPMLDVFESGPVADGIREAQGYYNDPSHTGALVVSLPEPLVISETLELIDGLRRDEVGVSGVVVNQLPETPWSDAQRDALVALMEKADEPLWGGWSLQRISDGYDALAMLREQVAAKGEAIDVVTIPEHATMASPLERIAATTEVLCQTKSQ